MSGSDDASRPRGVHSQGILPTWCIAVCPFYGVRLARHVYLSPAWAFLHWLALRCCMIHQADEPNTAHRNRCRNTNQPAMSTRMKRPAWVAENLNSDGCRSEVVLHLKTHEPQQRIPRNVSSSQKQPVLAADTKIANLAELLSAACRILLP